MAHYDKDCDFCGKFVSLYEYDWVQDDQGNLKVKCKKCQRNQIKKGS